MLLLALKAKVRTNSPIFYVSLQLTLILAKTLPVNYTEWFMTKLVNFDAETLSSSLEGTQPHSEWLLGLAKQALSKP